jgi:hypothetical protein
MAGGIRTGTPIANSCRFNDDDTAFQLWTPGVAQDDLHQWTFSFWFKPGNYGITGIINSGGSSTTNRDYLYWSSSGRLTFIQIRSNITVGNLGLIGNLRDPSSWYHIVMQYDSDQAASADRMKWYVNGVEEFATQTDAIDSARSAFWMRNGEQQGIGRHSSTAANYFDGYLSDLQLIDGLTVAPTDFGEFNLQGHWIPKTYTGSYGTNGYHHDYAVAPGTGNGAGTDVLRMTSARTHRRTTTARSIR